MFYLRRNNTRFTFDLPYLYSINQDLLQSKIVFLLHIAITEYKAYSTLTYFGDR